MAALIDASDGVEDDDDDAGSLEDERNVERLCELKLDTVASWKAEPEENVSASYKPPKDAMESF